MRIVVVEDEATLRRGIIQFIEQMNERYQVVGETDNGADGERIILELQPDLIITDIKMPDMSGLEMLEKLKAQHFEYRSVILSGYSEFEYAKRAISAGVQEYLLKPFTGNELRRVLAELSLSIELKRSLDPAHKEGAASFDYYFNSLLLGAPVNLEVLAERLLKEYNLNIRQPFYLAAIYLHENCNEAEQSWEKLLYSQLDKTMKEPVCTFALPADHLHLLLLTDQQSIDQFYRVIKQMLMAEQKPPNMASGFIKCEDMTSFRMQLTELKNDLQWSIVLGDQIVIDHERIQTLVTQIVRYPVELERQIILEIHAIDLNTMYSTCQEFLHYWRSKLYHPEDVIHAFVQFCSAIVNAAHKASLKWEQTLNLRRVYLKLMDSLTWSELSGTLLELYAEMQDSVRDYKLEYSPVIKRVIHYIDLHLHERITQLEVADKLRITPEYLSLLFAKEVGNNFNAYVREKKMNRAKELLIESELSGYEISSLLGFTDPKYFYKVFKNVTGLSTSDFIKIHRR
ncbi:hypothetical protein AMQ84_04380 [Paenibacillus riograndensis]|uniref:AraC family transcriptional regulator n=1 Tax=Paenibacillus riograndensis TaxID=483937 RepID=A0A132U969_9BACL|nr:response regulator [Paenibacillus riograndensis]KWX80224.1 hypothetical protein AMQ84_04380 [Paenibacillus riograndensis]